MCNKKICKVILAMVLVCGIACTAQAQSTADKGTSQGKATVVEQTAPKATNMASAYPLQADVLPAIPPTPKSISDTEAITKWVAAVTSYMDAAQKYIDGATDDLNHIAEQRNMAIENANKVVAEYNAFFEKHQVKK